MRIPVADLRLVERAGGRSDPVSVELARLKLLRERTARFRTETLRRLGERP